VRILKWLGGIVLVIAMLIAGLFFGARLNDGPIAMFPGGPLESGDLVPEPIADWAFAADVETIEMQLVADGNRSRTTWILVSDASAFIPVTLGFPPGKSWHLLAAERGAAVVRVDGTRYPVTLVRIEDPELLQKLGAANSAKYPPAPGSSSGVAYFRLDHRPL
jgi:hypothetical protein